MKLVLDGAEFPFPEDLTMGEHRLFKKYTGMSLAMLDAETAFHDPDVMAAFMHIAIARANPHVPEKEIERRVNLITKVDAVEEPGDAEDPPTMTQTPSDVASEPGTSGPSSPNGSADSQVTIPASTGTQG